MKVAKQFQWEAAHRLPCHEGDCRNLHGHSYRMFVELSGPVGPQGMVADFKEIKAWGAPLMAAWDHATLVSENDEQLLGIVRENGWKHAVLPYETTAENLCLFAAETVALEAGERLAELGVDRIRVRICETETCYAEYDLAVG